MAHSTRPVPILEYFGSQANQLANNAASRFSSAFDRIRGVLTSLGNTLRSASYGLRQEVPFERWFFDHGFQNPIDNPVDQIKARAWALAATLEGGVRITAEAASYVFSLAIEPQDSHRHLDVLKAQLQGFSLSLLAILSPNDAKAKAHNGGNPIIGSSLIDWKWGSLYTGKVDAPFWQVECRHYPWADRPAQ
ncbi:MAG: hypothetical protein JSS60_02960 [Verrucomicrobia bacterium]|nr:hypothetical protein [Verrucomicrobiota bacterium]